MDFVERKLQEWGLEKYIPSFKDNEVDEETFYLLDDETIKELIRPVGPRLKFKRELELLKAVKSPHTDQVVDTNLSTSDATQPSSEASDDDFEDISWSAEDAPDAILTPLPASKSHSNTSDELQSTSTSTPQSHIPTSKNTSSALVATPTSRKFSANTSAVSPVATEPLPAAKKQRKDFDVRDILSQLNNKTIIEEMDNGLISYQTRKKVVNALVSYLITKYGKYPKTDVKLAMAKAIMRDFKNLDNEHHDGYEAWFSTSHDHEATGFLENRLRNLRRRDPDKTKPQSTAPESSNSRLISTVDIDLTSDDYSEADIASMVTWLKYHNDPVEQVREMMAKTAKARASEIRTNKDKQVSQILTEYPRLVDTEGMIQQDFKILFPEACDELFMKWPNLFQRIFTYADKQVNWRDMLRFQGDLSTDEEKSNIAIQLLPLLFPPGMTCEKGKKGPNRHASVREALMSFIQFEEVGTNIPTFLEGVKQRQPFILALGERKSPEQVFVIMERNALPCGNGLLKALDLCLKAIYVLDMNYPWECQNTWDFIQKFIYGLGKGKGKQSSTPAVSMLRNFLTKK